MKSGLGLSFIEFEEAQEHKNNNQLNILPVLDFDTPLYFVVLKRKKHDPIIKAIQQEVRIIWNLKL